jgi:5-(carboxyamino)imidazole ribonucleotide synthase
LAAVTDDLLPGILKTARMGYDGKGQIRVKTLADLAAAWQQLKQVPCVLEKMLPLAAEASVIVARGADGTVVHLPPQRNLHLDGILAVTEVYADNLPQDLQGKAIAAARSIANGIGYVGVLCVEFFVLADAQGGVGPDSALVVNEMAPRPHNSGHYSMDACDVCQFELQVRAMTGLPLVQPRQHSAAIMLNLLGDLWFAQGDCRRDAALGAGAATARHPFASVWQSRGAAWPQDGPPQHHRRHARSGSGGCPPGGRRTRPASMVTEPLR